MGMFAFPGLRTQPRFKGKKKDSLGQRNMWPVCDHQTGTQPFLNLTEAFTSQGDLFVLGAKSPQRGDSCFHFSFQTEVHPWKRLQSPSPPLSSPPALHTVKKGTFNLLRQKAY